MLKLKELNFQLVIGITAFLNLRTIVNSERVCTVLAGIDEPLFNHYDKNISYLTDLIETHFDGVNNIFENNKTGPFRDSYSDVKFKLGRIQVMFGSCDSFKYENCTENRSKYLEIFDQYDFREFCLAYMFTFLYVHIDNTHLNLFVLFPEISTTAPLGWPAWGRCVSRARTPGSSLC